MARTPAPNLLLLLLSVIPLDACSTDTGQLSVGPRNVILFIGDGFGATQTALGIQYARLVEQRELYIDALMQELVTGDHGTGGFSFTDTNFGLPEDLPLDSGIDNQPEWGYPTWRHLELLGQQSASYSYILQQAGLDSAKLIELVLAHIGNAMTMDEAEDGLPGTMDFRRYHDGPDDTSSALFGLALAEYSFAVWSTGEHTMDPIPTYDRGPGAEKLRGIYPNTHIYSVMRESLERDK